MIASPVRFVDETSSFCLNHVVRGHAERNPKAPAILAPGRRPLTYGILSRQVEEVVEALNSLGVGRNDRVAMVLPDGPEMAVAFVAITSCATCAPLNPAYRTSEFDFYLADLDSKALLVMSGSESPALAVARARGISILELSPVRQAEAGLFTLAGERRSGTIRNGSLRADDFALALYTSGTVARSKLVPLTHKNICASAEGIRRAVELTASDRCLNVMPLFHIHGLSALFASLAAGGSVVCTSSFSVPEFFEWLDACHPTWYTAAPSIHQVILENAALHPETISRSSLRFIRSASSAMPRQVMAELERLFRVPFIEAYGMTEAAPQIASNRLPPHERKPGSVGLPAGPDVAIMDEAGNLLPPLETGEVVVRGANVMQAYANDPAANRSAFHDGWFRTGDRGHLDFEGHLFITGRLKEIINRGGEKFSPREVDEVLMEHPAIAQALTFAVPHPTLGESVAAVVMLRGSASATEAEIRQFAAMRLAHFKLPQPIVMVDEIPKGPTGKPQRIGLAEKLGLVASGADQAGAETEVAAPRTPTELKLMGIMAEVLGLDRLGIHDNFFQLGGDSLMATQVTARLRKNFGIELSMRSLFERPTVAELGQLISQQIAERAPLELRFPVEAPSRAACVIRRRSTSDACPLSFAQQRLWFLDQIEPGSPSYNMHVALRLTGALRVAVLEQTLSEILRRHEALRTSFRTVGGKSVQVIAAARPLRLPVVDLSELPAFDRESETQRLAADEAGRPFHLVHGVLFRTLLVRLEAEEHVLLVTMHHIVSDGWSMGVFYRELGVIYEALSSGRTIPLQELPIQYSDYALWQRERLQGEALESLLAYWKERLRDRPPALTLPTDRPRPALRTSQGARRQKMISLEVTEGLMTLSRQENATLFMVLLAAFKTLLFRYSGQEDLLVGTPIAHRTLVETEGLIGFFANTLIMRTDLSGDPCFKELLGRIQAAAMDAYAHQDLPFEKLVEELQPKRDPGRTPLFQVMFAFQNVPMPSLELAAGLTARALHVDREIAKFDLTLYLSKTAQGLEATWQYNTDLFEAATVERMSEHFRALLKGIVADPRRRLSELPLVSDAERHKLLVEWNKTDASYPQDTCFHHLFEEQVRRTPDAVAVQCETRGLTYRELNRRANQLAWRLQRLGVRPESLVGICMTRSAEMVVALLGVLKAGGAYVALDPEYPTERLAFMLEDAQAPVLITERGLRDRLPRHGAAVVDMEADEEIIFWERTEDRVSETARENLAYVIYTSGSTGRPKGVMITHACVCHYVRAMREALGITAADRWLHTASFAFSSSVRQFLVPLSCGATVVIAATGQILDPRALFQFIQRARVSIIDIVPSYWRTCNQVLARIDRASRETLLDNQLRLILSASELLFSDLPKEWAFSFDHGAQLINMFGQTETTGIVTVHPISVREDDAIKVVPIGRPIANTSVYVLDASRQPVPAGITGEVYIGGSGVGRGYHNQPELTVERFLPDPFSETPGARLYRTGDLARYMPDGNIEFFGRTDHQIKIRGFRIEPAEIEVVLGQHPGVRENAVVVQGDEMGGKRLVAYVVPREVNHAADNPAGKFTRTASSLISELRQFLRQKLPDYMVPSPIVELETMPRTPNGKIDRKAFSTRFVATAAEYSSAAQKSGSKLVPAVSSRSGKMWPEVDEAYRAPRIAAEEVLAAIWADVLNLDRVGIDDNFFDLGGDSILSIQIINQAIDAGLGLKHIHIFQHQTIAELASAAAPGALAAVSPVPSIEQTPRRDRPVAEDIEPPVRVTVESLRGYGIEALERAGMPSEGAAIVTEVQMEASLRGQPTHSMGTIPRYARRIASGATNPRPSIRIERETATSALIDGDNGQGQWVGVVAMELAIRKARESGVGVVGARRSNHFGAAGHYAWLAARENLIGLCTSNAPLWLAPTGGITPTFGNNPLGVGIPAGRHLPILLDISMSVAAKGKIGLHLAEGNPLPPDWILDRFGRPSTDPADLAASLGMPLGGHKGYGLTLVMETLAGVLTGAGFCWDHRRERMGQIDEPSDLGQFFLAINPELFMPIAEFTARVDRMIEQAKSGERADHVKEILVPGEAEMRMRARSLIEGVPLAPSTYRALRKYRETAGLKTELILVS